VTTADLDRCEGDVELAFAPLIGLPSWNVKQGHGSSLTFEFGDPRLVIREPKQLAATTTPAVQRIFARRRVHLHGAWHLWIYCCNWRLQLPNQDACHSESADWTIKSALTSLDGQQLLSVSIDAAKATSAFRFDLGGLIETWPYVSEAYTQGATADPSKGVEQWMLYTPHGQVFSYYDDGRRQWQDGDEQ
jgi:hypothetical protein